MIDKAGNNICPRLIEVALPIREISTESVRDKSLRHGHISTLHLWWARRPLAASRAVMFASLVPDPDDPHCPIEFRDAVDRLLRDAVPPILKSYYHNKKQRTDNDPYRPYKSIPDTPRNRLLTFIAKWSPQQIAFDSGQALAQNGKVKEPPPKEVLDDRCLVKWETSDPENKQGQEILRIARELVHVANGGKTPVVLDPFAGGGAIPLEAGRLGCQAIANDYNPVAYLILRATCEFPQKYGKPGKRKVVSEEFGKKIEREIEVPNVLAHDVEHWAKWILERAREKIGHLYLPGKDGKPVVGYLWARTAPCSNPTCRAEIPLLKSMLICNKDGKRVALTMTRDGQEIVFGVAKNQDIKETVGTMIQKGKGSVRCPVCQQTTPVEDLRSAGLEGKIGERMVAVITDTSQGKDYRPVEATDLEAFEKAKRLAEYIERPNEYIVPEINAPNAPADAGAHRSISVDLYGIKTWGALFNDRQLVAMQTFIECLHHALAGLNRLELDSKYCQAVCGYLGLWISKISTRCTTIGVWDIKGEKFQSPFGRQSLAMTWDYPEVNVFGDLTAGAISLLGWTKRYIEHESLGIQIAKPSICYHGDAATLPLAEAFADVVVTDPPYFDAIAYADLADFFYVWLKRGLSDVFPDTFVTPQTPKSQEAVAHKHRHHGNRQQGKEHFQRKLTEGFSEAKRACKSEGVMAVMFAHQDTEAWSALINALFDAGLNITATYPIDTELTTALKAEVSALASSITVICRPREVGVAASFRDVRREIDEVVANSVHRFFEYGLRGADLIVACYGPAVGVFGRYERVERADGALVGVPELLALVRGSALKAIAGQFEGDNLSRLYFVWANLYGIGEDDWDSAVKIVQIGGDAESAMEVAKGHGIFVVDGSTCRLALLSDRAERHGLGVDSNAPLIDSLHRSMLLWKEEKRAELVKYLAERDLLEDGPFWKLAQALFEVLPHDIEDWKLVNAIQGERQTLRVEAKRDQIEARQSQSEPRLF